MLEAARARQAAGVDVVIGWVETHGRAETEALLPGLERLPPRTVEYRGATLREFDLDAALARRPALILVDELAHTNAPGSRHAKRWQDVTELLATGIDVYTTLNVQHIESLNDVVARVTGVPDAGNGSGLDPRDGRRGRAGRSPARRPDPAAQGREGLLPHAGGRGRPEVLPEGQPDRPPGAGTPDDRGARGRPDGGLPPRPRRPGHLARGGAHPGVREPEPPRRPRRPRGPAHGGGVACRMGRRQRGDARHRPALGSRPRSRHPNLAPGGAARRRDRHADRPRRPRGGPRVRAPPQRHPHRPGQTRTAPLAGAPLRVGGERTGAPERRHRRLRHHRRARGTAASSGGTSRAARGLGRLWPGCGNRRPLHRGGVGHVSLLRARQPHHGVLAGHGA